MSLARVLDRIFREQFRMHVAWMPLTTGLALGDYGLWRGGVFVPLGNVAEFGVQVVARAGAEASLDYTSATAVQGGGGVERRGTPRLGGAAGEARLRFASEAACVLHVARLTSTRIANLAEVARRLDEARGWRWRFKIVNELFVGEDVLLLMTSEKDTEITVRGEIGALKARRAAGGLEVAASKRLGLEIVGGAGPIGLRVARVRLNGAPALAFDAADGEDPRAVVDGEGQVREIVEDDAIEEPVDDL